MRGTRECILFQQWREVVARRRQAVAVRSFPGGASWTFLELDALLRDRTAAPPVLQTSRTGLAFLIDVLTAWRDNALLVPDDTGGAFSFDASIVPAGPCHLKITSGSTGARQAVMFGPEHLAADVRQIMATMGLREDLPNIGVISLAHSYGFSNLVLPLLLHGIPLWLVETPFPDFLRGILSAGNPPVTVPAVPAMWRAWNLAGLDFAAIGLAISAGAALPIELESSVFARTGCKIHNFYGSSECGGIAYDASLEPRNDPGLAGTALHGVHLSVAPESACLVVDSAATGLGYLGGSPFLDGKFPTRDLADLAPGGELFLRGRTGETIHVAGYKVAPGLIEEALSRLPGVRACLAFGVPSADPIRTEDVVVVANATAPLAELKSALAHLPSSCHPRHWWICPELETDSRGKIPRQSWKNRWLARHRP